MSFERGKMIYEGKAKRIYEVVGHDDQVWVEFKDSLTAFNAQKKGSFSGKGRINAEISVLIFAQLSRHGVPTHLLKVLSPSEMLCQKIKIIPLEVVVRNRLAGSTAKKFGLSEGTALSAPLVEFFYKDDALGDPFVSDEQALMLKVVSRREDLDELRKFALLVNRHLHLLFAEVGIELVDFKIELGRNPQNELVLADEISPDCCRLWDMKSGEKMDKDRFRRDLGGVEENYREILMRLEQRWGGK